MQQYVKHFSFLWLMIGFYSFPVQLFSQKKESYFFSPNYALPGKAENIPGNFVNVPSSHRSLYHVDKQAPVFLGKKCTDQIEAFISEPLSGSFSIEFTIVHHFNKPAGLVFYFMNQDSYQYSLSYFSEKDRATSEIGIYDFNNKFQLVDKMVDNHYQKYWQHFILSVTRDSFSLYHNGVKISESKRQGLIGPYDLQIGAYLEEEPYASIKNLLNYVTIYRDSADKIDPSEKFNAFKDKIDKGVLYPHLMHFNAGPYLHYSTESSINLIWETDVPTKTIIEYGEELPFSNSVKIEKAENSFPFIYEATLKELKSGQKYFYNILVENNSGDKMESGVLTFKTSEIGSNPILFGIIGDTETRPHINDKISKQLWAERPDFVMLLGDLTDGGMKDAKWQWNLEYFAGMTQLFSRVPVFPVPGNGEGDLYWYKKYHSLPNSEAYYSFKYGEAEFFMLNSNERKKEFLKSGIQYQWLDSALAYSTAKWKFVALHHAPYSTDEDDYGDSYKGKSNHGDEHVKPLIPLFEKHHIDAVFFGHLHSYNRIGPITNNQYDSKNGVWYIQSGGAGGNTEDFEPTHHWMSQKSHAGHHYCTVSLSANEMILKTFNLQGNLIDMMTLKK